MNGMPIVSYEEVSSQHWNLMYKTSGSEGQARKFLNISEMDSKEQLKTDFSPVASWTFGKKKTSVFEKKRHSNQSADPTENIKKQRYKANLEFKNAFQQSLDLTESLDDEIPHIDLAPKNSGPFLKNSNVNIKNCSTKQSSTGFKLPSNINHQSGGITPYAPKMKTMANSPRNMSLTQQNWGVNTNFLKNRKSSVTPKYMNSDPS